MAPRGPNDEEGVIDPEDLDIAKNEQVHKLDDGQYVIATGDSTLDNADLDRLTDKPAEANPAGPEAESELDPRAAIIEHMQSVSAAQGIVAVGRFDGVVRAHEGASDDLGAVFHDLLRWYAASIDADTPPEEVLGILCLAGGLRIQYPVRTLVELLNVYGLSPDDSIRELIEAVQEDGFVLPPANEEA